MHGSTPHPLPPPPAMLRPMMLLLLVARAEAWVTISQSYWGAQLNDIRAQMGVNTSVAVEPVQRLGYLWTSPAESASERGMGGGLTWAIDPNLCENLLSSFQEQPFLGISFVTCREIQAALHRGFSAWADNSAKLRFVDVSKECAAAGFTDATCPLAKIFVTWLTPANLQALDGNGRRRLAHGPHADDSGPDTEHSLISAERQSKGGDTAALARSFPGYTNTFRRCAAKPPDDFSFSLSPPASTLACPSPLSRAQLKRRPAKRPLHRDDTRDHLVQPAALLVPRLGLLLCLPPTEDDSRPDASRDHPVDIPRRVILCVADRAAPLHPALYHRLAQDYRQAHRRRGAPCRLPHEGGRCP